MSSSTKTSEQWASELASITPHILSAPAEQVESSISKPDAAFARYIDHTLLKPDATPAQIDALCDEALKYNFKSCCVNTVHVEQVAKRLEGSESIPCVVVGFPLGAMKTDAKAFETKSAVASGAQEIDMVISIGHAKTQNWAYLYSDVRAVVEAAGSVPVKVILETVFLSDEEKVAASYISAEAGAAFVKTCTGFSGGAASAHDVALMKRAVAHKNGAVKVKASAGVRTFESCLEMIKAGAERIGTSSGRAIIEGAAPQGSGY